jgi:hypothetical protein
MVDAIEATARCFICGFSWVLPYRSVNLPLCHRGQSLHSQSTRLADCGHTFCLPCLQGHLSPILRDHLMRHLRFRLNVASAMGPKHNECSDLFRQGLNSLRRKGIALPDYGCPFCAVRISRRPIECGELNVLGESLSAWLPQLRSILGVPSKEDNRASLSAMNMIVTGCDLFFFD